MWKIAGFLGVISLLTFLIPVRADEDAKLREVVDRAIKAHGGHDNLTKFKASVSREKGKFHGQGAAVDFTSETSMQLPDRFRFEVKSRFGDQELTYIQVINGNKGWVKNGNKTDEMNKEMLEHAKEDMNMANIIHLVCLKEKDYQLSPLGEVKAGDRPAVGIRVAHKGFRDVSLFFDKENGLLLKTETQGKDPMKGEEYTAETQYDDYKKVDGMMLPHKITIKRDGKLYVEGELTEEKHAEKLDDSLFEKP